MMDCIRSLRVWAFCEGGDIVVPKGVGPSWGPPLIWYSLAFHIYFFLLLEVAATLATMTLHAFSGCGFSHMDRLRTASCQQSI
jgi:hypothetical protein